jgi:glycosyltransferase involved in cell wall biosynthesis
MTPPRVNLVVPCYNEQGVLPETSRQLLAMLKDLQEQGMIDQRSSVTFVDDGSSDQTWQLIEELHDHELRVHGIKLSRNYGHQNALLAGLLSAPGDVIISLDADLQDDLKAILRMLEAYQSGADIVYGVRAGRASDSVFKRWTARAYYSLLRWLGVEIIPDHADFRLMDRRALNALRDFHEVNLFLRGIIPLLGFRTAVVSYDRLPRAAGESKYPFLKMLKLGMDGIVSFSTAPLRWITVIGAIVSIASMGVGFWALFVKLTTDLALPGWASIVVPMYFLGGLQLLALGIIGSYLSRIYTETKQRPRFIIEKSL